MARANRPNPLPARTNAADHSKDRPVAIYFAAPLFTLLERRANRALARAIGRAMPEAHILLPQDFKHEGKFNDARAFGLIFKQCIDAINHSQAMLAWLDGSDADSGTCFEVGYAHARGLPVVGVRTDFRHNQERGLNIMLSRACTAFVYRPSFDEDVEGLADSIANALRKALSAKR